MTHVFFCSLVAVCREIKQKLANPSDVLLPWIALTPSLKESIALCMDYWTNLPVKTPDLLNHVQLHSQSRPAFVEMQDSYLSREGYVASIVNALLPPESLDDRHQMKAAYDQVESGNFGLLAKMKIHVRQNWKPNATLFVSIKGVDS